MRQIININKDWYFTKEIAFPQKINNLKDNDSKKYINIPINTDQPITFESLISQLISLYFSYT